VATGLRDSAANLGKNVNWGKAKATVQDTAGKVQDKVPAVQETIHKNFVQ
jgi:hypothetical protein